MSRTSAPLSRDPLWYKSAIIYELHVRSFADGDGDGVGDFPGLIQRLDYLKRLGVGALWLQPFYPSPQRDDGYDIADYFSINPAYGSLADFRRFLREAHSRGLKVITELVLNHTSDTHPWFQRARRAMPGSAWRNFYVWSETPERYRQARIIFKDFEHSNWAWDPQAKAYYWHRFYSHQPDLNYDNPLVRQAMLKVVDHWLGLGVDGLRLDAVPYLYERPGTNCENLPETHAFLKDLRAHVDAKYPDRMLLAEANQWPEDAVDYFGAGDECHMAFHFPIMPRIFMALWNEDRSPIIDIMEQTPAIPEGCQWALFLRNHDELTLEMVSDEERDSMYRAYARETKARLNLGIRRRLAPLMQNDRRKMEVINVLLFSFPGTPILYYGDELGMGDNYHLGDRNGVRTPMQWSPDRNAGFSKANPQSLYLPVIIDPEYHYEVFNVETEERNPSSFLWWIRRLLAAYKSQPALGRGGLAFLPCENIKTLALMRGSGEESLLAVANLSRHSQVAELDLSAHAGCTPADIFGGTRFPVIGAAPYVLTLGPYGYFWFRLEHKPDEEVRPELPRTLPARQTRGLCLEERRPLAGSEALPRLLAALLPGRDREWSTDLRVRHEYILRSAQREASLLLVDGPRDQGTQAPYFAVLSRAARRDLPETAPHGPGLLAEYPCPGGGSEAVLDGLRDPESLALLTSYALEGRRRTPDGRGFRSETYGRRMRRTLEEIRGLKLRLLPPTAASLTCSLGNSLFLKVFTRPEEGPNPDLVLPRTLSALDFPGVPRVLASLHYRRPLAEDMTVAVITEYVQGTMHGDDFARESLARFFENALAGDAAEAGAEALMGEYALEVLRLLGSRTAEMHLALAGAGKADFEPEPFTRLYLRSLYQALRSQTHRSARAAAAARLRDPSVPALDKEGLFALFARVVKLVPDGQRIRIHGDLQLENVLVRGSSIFFVDFEGDGRLPLSERSIKRSPLRDVAAMLLSLSLAAEDWLAGQDNAAELRPRLAQWRDTACRTYAEAYFQAADQAAFLPRDPEVRRLLLRVFALDQALRGMDRAGAERPRDTALLAGVATGLLGGLP